MHWKRHIYLARIVVRDGKGKDTLCSRCKLIHCDGSNYLPTTIGEQLFSNLRASASATSRVTEAKKPRLQFSNISPKQHNPQEKNRVHTSTRTQHI
jgi:hypothetical protein